MPPGAKELTCSRMSSQVFSRPVVSLLRSCILGLLCLGAVGCDRVGSVTANDLAGTYVYKFRTGEVEELILRPDLTFHQALFPSSESFVADRQAMFSLDGPWIAEGHRVKIALMDLLDRKTLDVQINPQKREFSGDSSLFWRARWRTWQPVLLRDESLGDVLQKVSLRDHVFNSNWDYPVK